MAEILPPEVEKPYPSGTSTLGEKERCEVQFRGFPYRRQRVVTADRVD